MQQVAARRRCDKGSVERPHQRAEFVVRVQPGFDLGAVQFGAGTAHRGDQVIALCPGQLAAKDVQALRNQFALDLVETARQAVHVPGFDIEFSAMIADQDFQFRLFGRIIGDRPVAFEQRLELAKTLVKPGLGQRRRQIADQRRARTALGNDALGRIVRRIEIEVRQIAEHPLRPAVAAQTRLLAGHELERAMGAEMQRGMGPEILADIAVEGREGMGGGKIALEQQPHRITLIAEGRLHPDEDITEMRAENMDALAIALLATGSRSPLRLNFPEMGFPADMVIGADPGCNIGISAELVCIAMDDGIAKLIHRLRGLDGIAFILKTVQRRVQRFEHRQMGGGTGGPGVGREVEQDNRKLARGSLGAAQLDQAEDLAGQRVGALGTAVHRPDIVIGGEFAVAAAAGAALRRAIGPTAENAGSHRAIQFGNGQHHRRFQRQKAHLAGTPLLERLEFDRMRRDIGHVETGQRFHRSIHVVIGGTADQREAGQVDDRIDLRLAVPDKKFLDRRPGVEAVGEGGNDAQATGFQRPDHAVIMAGIAAEQIGAQHQQPDRAGRLLRCRQSCRIFGQPLLQVGMIDTHFGIFTGWLGSHLAKQRRAVARGIAVDQRAHHVDDIVVRSGQPVLHGQEILPDILRRTGNEAENLGQPPQHLHLAGTGTGARLLRAAQLLEQRQWPLGRPVHAVTAEPGQLDDIGGGHQADDRVAIITPFKQGGPDRLHMVFEEQHGGDDDICLGDVGLGALENRGIAVPVGSGIDADADIVLCHPCVGALDGTGEMIVQGDDDHADGGAGATWHNGPLLRTASPARSWRRPVRRQMSRCSASLCPARKTEFSSVRAGRLRSTRPRYHWPALPSRLPSSAPNDRAQDAMRPHDR